MLGKKTRARTLVFFHLAWFKGVFGKMTFSDSRFLFVS